MALIDLKTNLKSLRYGNDTLGGGDSGQPYIVNDINNPTDLLGKDDGFVRGGTFNAIKTGIRDVKRIGGFLKNNPLWITKQVGLQLSNPRLEVPKNPDLLTNPSNLIAYSTNGLLEPTRIYNLGLNTLAEVPVNAFGIHFNRHGLSPITDDKAKYEYITTKNNNQESALLNIVNAFTGANLQAQNYNRLLRLKDSLLRYPNINDLRVGIKNVYLNNSLSSNLGKLPDNSSILGNTLSLVPTNISSILNSSGVISILSSTTGAITNRTTLVANSIEGKDIDRYLAGPGSVYGIGTTTIKRTEITDPTVGRFLEALSISKNVAANGTRFYTDNLLIPRKNQFLGVTKQAGLEGPDGTISKDQTAVDYGLAISNPTLRTYASIAASKKENISQSIPFSDSPHYKATGPSNYPFSSERRFFKTNKNIGLNRDRKQEFNDYNYYGKQKVSDDGSQSEYDNTYTFDRYDSDIMTVVFRGVDPFNLNEERWIFPAYINGFRDNFDATWNDVNYIGRSETFYIYSKFKRSVNFSLKIPCFNRKQLFEKHRALGQLASTTAGRYNDTTKALGGVLLRLNVGNYLVGEYATLNNLSYSIPDDSAWDITPEARLAMYIEAQFSFNIVHQKLPEYIPSRDVDGTSKPVGFFGYLQDSVPGDDKFIQNPNRTEEEQQSIIDGFTTSLVNNKDSKGILFSSTKPVVDYDYNLSKLTKFTVPEVDPNTPVDLTGL